MPSPPPPTPFGRVRLDQVIDAWSASSAFNPRMLASELAALLRASGPTQPIGANAATVVMFDPATGSGALTFGTLAAYFERYSAEGRADTVETTTGTVRAGAVYLARSWIGRLEVETEALATIAAGLQQAHPAPWPSGGAQPADQHRAPVSGSDPECLALHQAQQRQAGELSAGERLDVEQQHAARLEQENTKLIAQRETLGHRLQQAQEEREDYKQAALEERRRRILGEERNRELTEALEAAEARAAKAVAERLQRQPGTIRPLILVNAAKAAAIGRAKAIAAELWQADTAQKIRVGEMADLVYRALVNDGFTESLPGNTARIQEWIKAGAPEYARKGGRRRKTP